MREKHIYKQALSKRIFSFISVFVVPVVSAIIVGMIFHFMDLTERYGISANKWSIIVGIIIGIIVLWQLITDSKSSCIVTDGYFIFKEGKNEETYKISECGFYAKTSISDGISYHTIDITDQDGTTHYVDCSFLSMQDFDALLGDLGITGSKAPVNKVNQD